MKFDPVRFTAVCFLANLGLSASPIVFNLTDLGSRGGSMASGNAVNNNGQTAATMSNPNGSLRAISNGADITPPGASDAMAASINSAGQIAGTTFAGGIARATVWTNGTPQVLAAMGSDAYGMAINDSSQVTGMYVTGLGFGHAFLNTAGVMADLGVLAGGSWSSGYAINSSGQIAGYGDTADGNFAAFLWSGGSGFTQLGTLGGENSYAMGLNASGKATGSADLASGYSHAFYYNGTLHDLGTLGGNNSRGYSINASGSIVGYSDISSDDSSHAFLYKNNVLYDLNWLLAGASGWELTAAYGINDAGQITGTGWYHGVEHAFLLNPVTSPLTDPGPAALFAPAAGVPEPGSLTLFAVGVALIGAAKLLQRSASRPHQPGVE